jgi:hypothetical protein
MGIKFGGQQYQAQCPVCHAALRWSKSLRESQERIDRTARQHYQGCPAVVLDPPHLVGLTSDQALSLIAGL